MRHQWRRSKKAPRRSTGRRDPASVSSSGRGSDARTASWRTRSCRSRRPPGLLRALERNGLAQRRRGGGFRPGPVLVEYARRDTSVGDLATLAWPFLERLGQTTGETANVAIPTPTGVARVAQVDSRHPLGAGNWVGSRIPIHASSMGKVFMAFGAAQPPFGRLARLGPSTITRMDDLLDELDRVRRVGLRDHVGGARGGTVLDGGSRTRLARNGHRRDLRLGAHGTHIARPPRRALRRTSSRRRTRCPTHIQETNEENEGNESGRDPATALRQHARRQQARGRRAHRAGARAGHRARRRCCSTR